MKKLLLSLGVLLSLSLSLAGCNDDNAKSQGDDGSEPDFLVDVISGEVLENPEGDGVILELELSPKTVFIVARPSLDSGTINTEDFLEKILDVILGIVPLNAVLILTDEDGIAEAVPLVLNGGEFDRATVGTQFDVTPLDPDTNSGQPTNAAEGSPLPSGQTTFGQALLFIGIGPPGHLSKIAMSDTPDTMLSLLSALKAVRINYLLEKALRESPTAEPPRNPADPSPVYRYRPPTPPEAVLIHHRPRMGHAAQRAISQSSLARPKHPIQSSIIPITYTGSPTHHHIHALTHTPSSQTLPT